MTDNSSKSSHESLLTPAQKSRFVLRAVQTHAPLLATMFAQYTEDEGITWEALAQSLQCTPEQLDSVAMCCPPRPKSFVADVTAIAEGYIEVDRLLNLLRHLQVLGIFREVPHIQTVSSPSQSITLLAAQDREASPAPELPENESDSSSY